MLLEVALKKSLSAAYEAWKIHIVVQEFLEWAEHFGLVGVRSLVEKASYDLGCQWDFSNSQAARTLFNLIEVYRLCVLQNG